MNDSDGPTNPPIWKSMPTKLRAYEAIYWLNRSFQATLLSLERLEDLDMFSLEYLNECKIRVECTRAETNEELMESLQQHEADESARFDRMQRWWEDLRKDPDDVFFQANDRKREIKDQMNELQKGLKRQKIKRKN